MTPPWLQPPGPYSGIGSRETPPDVLLLMVRIAKHLARISWTFRSGAAEGADTAFDVGAIRGGGRMGIWLPWPGFDQRRMRWSESMGWREDLESAARLHATQRRVFERATARAEEIAAKLHPAWNKLGRGPRALMSRNIHQVLGADCAAPSRFVVCWTQDGATEKTTSRTGGTGQAIRCAAHYGVRVMNLARDEDLMMWEEFVS